jgi:ubiquinone biosynthesis protein UbiJ
VVGGDLALVEPDDAVVPVRIGHTGDAEEEASGLAHILQQFLEQTLEDSPEKRRLARRLRGEAIFRAAEDPAIQVRMRFRGDGIELSDVGEDQTVGTASVTADFLTIAHLTSGQESPFALIATRKLRVRFRASEIHFLLQMLALMRITNGVAHRAWIWRAVLVAVLLAAVIYSLG